jgi:hypothetical protein
VLIGGSAHLGNLFYEIRQAGVLGLVWFDESQPGGRYRENWRIEGDRLAEGTFRLRPPSLALTRP